MKRPKWILVLGTLVFAFMLLPVLLVLYMSFIKSSYISFPPSGYSLRWFRSLGQHAQLFDGLTYSAQIAAAAMVVSVVLGVLGAIALSRSRLPLPRLFENGFTLPLVIPTIVCGVAVYIYLYQLSGIVNQRLVPTTWALVLAHTLITLPWTFRLCYAGLVGMAGDVERASLDLGRGPLATLWYVTVPLLRPSLIGAAILAFIFSFSDLEMSLFLVAPGRTTLPVAMVQYATFKVDPTLAAVSTVQIALIAVLLAIANKLVRFGDTFSGGTKQ